MNKDVKYERINDFECSKCPNAIWNAFQVIGTILLVLCFFIFMVIINVRKTEESELSVLLRILTNYLQLITASTSMTNNYPSILIAFTIPVRMFGGSTDAFLSFDCFIQDTDIKFVFNSNPIFKLFLLQLLPVVLFSIMLLMWVSVKFFKPEWVKDLPRNLVISFITIVFLLHPKMTEKSLNIFK